MDAFEQKIAAADFADRWLEKKGQEDEEDRSFWIEFYQDILGISNPTQQLQFQRKVHGRKIDVFDEEFGILVEQKSRGYDLDNVSVRSKKAGWETPYDQAKWYADHMPNAVRPRWIITSNFDTFRIYDLNQEYPEKTYVEIQLKDLPERINVFNDITNRSNSRLLVEKELSVQAGEIVGRLYQDLAKQYLDLENNKQEQESLNKLIVRFVFLLYAEDAGILGKHLQFHDYLESFPAEGVKGALEELFYALSTPEDKRDPYLSPKAKAFEYINGGLFSEEIIIPQLTTEIKLRLLEEASSEFDWSKISPTIFGAVFESTLNPETRRSGGMHYTSIENIHKVIDPLFLDDLKKELAGIEGEKIQRNRELSLKSFQEKLASICILDPAAGSGNFLTESYISLRRLENQVIEDLLAGSSAFVLSEEQNPIKISIDQFYGIELNDFAVEVAKVALWISEEQMMTETQEILKQHMDFFPLSANKNIVQGNALRLDWNNVIPAEKCTYIIGNPPFYGAMHMNKQQKQEMRDLFPSTVKNVGELDYVTAWYVKAGNYIKDGKIACALVSTNSLTQGLSVGTFWHLIKEEFGLDIDFAYQTFIWDNEVREKAHVHVVIIGFSKKEASNKQKTLFLTHGTKIIVEHINGYLMPFKDVYVLETSKPLSKVPALRFGSMPRAKGFTLTAEERARFIDQNPLSEKWIRPYWGAEEFLNGKERYCLWLKEAKVSEIEECPLVLSRIRQVREERLASKAAGTRKLADSPKLFAQIAQPEGPGSYLLIPRVSSERRVYIPIGFVDNATVASDLAYLMPKAHLYHFGVVSSQFHNAWVRTVAGRLESRYRYAKDLVYNTFIWPDQSRENELKIEQAARHILDTRDRHSGMTIGDMYKPEFMPQDLLDAHKALDRAVEEAYGVNFNGDEEKIVKHLFELYSEAIKKEDK